MPWHPIFLQLLWDLELLTGAGLRLFWPPWAQCCGLRDQAQCAWSQCSQPLGRTGGGPEQLTSWVSRGLAEGKGGPCDIGVMVVAREAEGVWALDSGGPGFCLCSDACWGP